MKPVSIDHESIGAVGLVRKFIPVSFDLQNADPLDLYHQLSSSPPTAPPAPIGQTAEPVKLESYTFVYELSEMEFALRWRQMMNRRFLLSEITIGIYVQLLPMRYIRTYSTGR